MKYHFVRFLSALWVDRRMAERFSRATEETKHRRHDARYNTHPPAEIGFYHS